MPVISKDDNRKLFVVCELNVGNDIIANVSYAGNTSGTTNDPILIDSFDFFISEGIKDFGVKFNYNGRDKNYKIAKDSLKLIPGEKYKFRGVSLNADYNEPNIVIPASVSIDGEMSAIAKDRKLVNGKYVTTIKVNATIGNVMDEDSYFYIEPILSTDASFVCKFDKDFEAFKPLKHKKGFLVDYKRITQKSLEFYLEVNETIPSTLLNLQVANVTPSFYKYNYYYSNASEQNGQIPDNQAIASFNIYTDKAFGSFSALNASQHHISIK